MLLEPFFYEGSGTLDANGNMIYPKNMDKMMIPVCNLINKIPGIQTIFCCQGHRFHSVKTHESMWSDGYVCMLVDDVKGLNFLSRAIKLTNSHITNDLFMREDRKTKIVFRGSTYHEEQCGTTRVRVVIQYKLTNAYMRTIILQTFKMALRQMLKEKKK